MQEDQAPEPIQPQFQVKLVQRSWITTEVFNSVNDPNVFGDSAPTTAEEAQAAAQKFVDEHKDLGDVEYRLEVEDVTPEPEPTEEEAATPEQASETETNTAGETQ